MTSYDFPYNHEMRAQKNYTIASTFRKPKSLVFELLFGDYVEKRMKAECDLGLVDVVDYVFEPGQIFGFSIKSLGTDYKNMHQCFVLKSLSPGYVGNKVPGVFPGAEVLLYTNGATPSKAFLNDSNKIYAHKKSLAKLDARDFQHLHRLIDAKLPRDYFLSRLLSN